MSLNKEVGKDCYIDRVHRNMVARSVAHLAMAEEGVKSDDPYSRFDSKAAVFYGAIARLTVKISGDRIDHDAVHEAEFNRIQQSFRVVQDPER